MGRWRTRAGIAGLAGAVVGLAGSMAVSRTRARGIPFSPVTAGWYVGADFPERAGIVDEDAPVPAGELDDLDDFARPDFDTGRVHPLVREFYEATSAFSMQYRARWHRPFRTGAALATRATSRIEQLNLPPPGDERVRRLESRFAHLKPAADPREGARAWVRTDPETGKAVFVALYAHHESGSECDGNGESVRPRTGERLVNDADETPASSRIDQRFVNIAVPLPGCNLSTVLRPETVDTRGGAAGIRLTTRAPGDPGLYLVRDGAGYRLPMAQRFEVRPADATSAPVPSTADADLAATHEMWLRGAKFLTVTYGITRTPACRTR